MANKRGRPKDSRQERRRHLTHDEWRRFIATTKAASAEDWLFFSLAYALALRVREAVELRWSDFNFPAKQVSVKGMKDGLLVTYPIPAKLLKELRATKRAAEERGVGEEGWVFPARLATAHTGHLGVETAKGAFRRYMKAAGIEARHSIHDLRHSLAFDLAADGHNASVIAAALRHKSTRSASAYLVPHISDSAQDQITHMLNRRLQ